VHWHPASPRLASPAASGRLSGGGGCNRRLDSATRSGARAASTRSGCTGGGGTTGALGGRGSAATGGAHDGPRRTTRLLLSLVTTLPPVSFHLRRDRRHAGAAPYASVDRALVERADPACPPQGIPPPRRRRCRRQEPPPTDAITRQAVTSWENGSSKPSPVTLLALSKALRVPTADLAPVRETDLRISDLRSQAGLTQAEVARALDVSTTVIGDLERGFRPVNADHAASLAELYRVTPARVHAVWQQTYDAVTTRLASRK
jgi:transcriptional regulator with XRE-family HTH domain